MNKLLFLSIILIFLFVSSSLTYEQQSLIGTLQQLFPDKPFESTLQQVEFNYFGHVISIENSNYYSFLEFFIRKGSHIIIFGLLAVSIYWLSPKWKFRYVTAFILTVCCACLDEFHQGITGGRTATVRDVVLNSFGAILFLLLIFVVTSQKNKASNTNR